ncbi:MAG TPA: hypothetical protein VF559_09435 [Caulobacteraceae bacterium]|jgi:hypothetical protein
MTGPGEDPRIDVQTVLDWQAQGLTLAEIGHRLGISADLLREVLSEAGADTGGLDGPDDHRPNTAEVR